MSIALILQGSITSIVAIKVVLSHIIISRVSEISEGDDQAAALELLVEKFEKDVGDWRYLSSSEMNPSVDEELECLMAQM